MATIKMKLRASSIAGKAGTVYYQVTHRRIVRQISTDIHILPEDWDGKRQCPKQLKADAVLQNRIQRDMDLLRTIIKSLDATGMPYTTDDIVRGFHEPCRTVTILAFMQACATAWAPPKTTKLPCTVSPDSSAEIFP